MNKMIILGLTIKIYSFLAILAACLKLIPTKSRMGLLIDIPTIFVASISLILIFLSLIPKKRINLLNQKKYPILNTTFFYIAGGFFLLLSVFEISFLLHDLSTSHSDPFVSDLAVRVILHTSSALAFLLFHKYAFIEKEGIFSIGPLGYTFTKWDEIETLGFLKRSIVKIKKSTKFKPPRSFEIGALDSEAMQKLPKELILE